MSCSSHSSWFGHPSNTWRKLEIKNFPIMQSSPRPCCNQTSTSESSSSTLSAYIPSSIWKTKFPTHTQKKNRKNYYLNITFIYKLIFIFLDSKLVVEMIPDQMVAAFPWIQSSLNFFIRTTAVSL
jgi:hypothetical protein